MDSSYYRPVAAACLLILLNKYRRMRNRPRRDRWATRRWWTKPWIERRNLTMTTHDLVHQELRFEDVEAFTRMKPEVFYQLLDMVRDKISKINTVMRQSSSPERR